MPQWITPDPAGLDRAALENALKTTLAAVISILVSRLLRLPDDYWAAVTTMVVMQSTLGASFPVSFLRFIGTAIGAVAGAVLAIAFGDNLYMFGAGIFALGLLTAAVHLDRSAFRFAGITVAIVVLVPRDESPWIIAFHRFAEISVGIVVGLVVIFLWPERSAAAASKSAHS